MNGAPPRQDFFVRPGNEAVYSSKRQSKAFLAAKLMAPIQYQDELIDSITDAPFAFLRPSLSLQTATLSAAKNYLDPLAAQISELQLERQASQRKKRKRNERHQSISKNPLAVKAVYINGFETEQIWAQARRILNAATEELRSSLPTIAQNPESNGLQLHEVPRSSKRVRFQGSDADDAHAGGAGTESDLDDLIEDGNSQMSEIGSEDVDEGELNPYDEGEDDIEAADDDDHDMDTASDVDEVSSGKETFAPDKLGLNDGFFSIDDFNKQSDFLEQQDASGQNDDAASDEEDVDWTLNPLAAGSGRGFDKGDPADGEEEQEESADEEDGPTFGTADLDSGDLSDVEMDPGEDGLDGMPSLSNTNDIMYTDFFAPPPRQLNKSARRRALPKTQPPPSSAPPQDEDIQRAISDVRRDIFGDDDEASDASSTPDESRSSHQKRQADITAEIRRLESEAVAKKPWALSGEARAGDRPLNSLLEEDLEFERAGKPVPVITAEVSEDIESLIKRRILNREFDEVIRRRPGSLATANGQDVRRGRIELDDSKPSQSLAEIYEAEHLKQADPDGFVDKRSEALKKEHEKIEALWKDVSAKLDALTNMNFKPRAVEASIKVLSDVPTIMMEDARPNAGADVGQSMLAPQEIYKPGESRDKKIEVVTRSGLPISREEMTREEKLRRRRREKERIKKAGGVVPNANKKLTTPSKKANERAKVATDLKMGGVKVIGKKGEIQDIEGRKVKGQRTNSIGAGNYKL